MMTPEQMREVMPMTRYWTIKRGVRKGVEALFAPMILTLGLAADNLKAMADYLQARFIYKEGKE
jgi:hypothetical protein